MKPNIGQLWINSDRDSSRYDKIVVIEEYVFTVGNPDYDRVVFNYLHDNRSRYQFVKNFLNVFRLYN